MEEKTVITDEELLDVLHVNMDRKGYKFEIAKHADKIGVRYEVLRDRLKELSVEKKQEIKKRLERQEEEQRVDQYLTTLKKVIFSKEKHDEETALLFLRIMGMLYVEKILKLEVRKEVTSYNWDKNDISRYHSVEFLALTRDVIKINYRTP